MTGTSPTPPTAADDREDRGSAADASQGSPDAPTSSTTDREGAERILDAAVELFGRRGFSATSLKAIAAHAGVSAPLVIHHFGSKAGLRRACDQHVARLFHDYKDAAVEDTAEGLPRNHVMEMVQESGPLIRYLLQAFLAGGEEIDALFDRLVDDSLEYTSRAQELGLVTPSENPRDRAAVMLLHSFGALVLHRQMKRQFGVDPLEDRPEDMARYMSAVLELYTRPLLDAEVYRRLMADLRDAPAEQTTGSPGSSPQEGHDR
ncbi:TetR/AcrR family transcriptional regulator [Nesterenkonia sp. F]|uniref:TetR/AcrR family transcriptional regulator n=1 Tax=Nesterenkonia sp. F TaxID=795955 RepID=UPI000255D2B4|nr:TetR family transcriptional regulator [Nesterenkonia sp. F]